MAFSAIVNRMTDGTGHFLQTLSTSRPEGSISENAQHAGVLQPGILVHSDRGLESPEHALVPLSSTDSVGATSLSSVFTLCNSAIGAGVLALPFAFSKAGLIGGLLICVAIGCCEGATLYVLSKFADRYRAASYSQLIHMALGHNLAFMLSVVVLLYQWGSCIAYMILGALRPDNAHTLRLMVMWFLSIAVLFPLCLPKRLGTMVPISAMAVLGFVYTARVICFRSYQIVSQRDHWLEGVTMVVWEWKALFAVPVVTFGFNCHPNVVSVFNELCDTPSRLIRALPSRLKMVGMLGVVLSALFTIMTGYVAVGAAGYLAYPRTVQDNVLNSFDGDDVLMQIARVVIGCVVMAHYPLNHWSARRSVEDAATQRLRWDGLPPPLSILFTVLFVVSSTAISMVTHLGQVIHLIGGFASSFLVFFLPGLLLVTAALKKDADTLHSAPEDQAEGLAAFSHDVNQPLLGQTSTRSTTFSPRKSWWGGVALMVLSVSILLTTVFT